MINPAMTYATGFIDLIKKYPKNYIDVGISEEHALSMASGVSLNQVPVFYRSIQPFTKKL